MTAENSKIENDGVTADLQHSDRVVRGLSSIAFLGHAAILAGAVLIGNRPLAIFNLISCALYVAVFFLCRRGFITTSFVIGILEVTAHAWFATWLLGFTTGFHIYALVLVPFVMFFDKWSVVRRSAVAVIGILAYGGLVFFGNEVFTNSANEYATWMRLGNLSVGAIVLGLLSYYYSVAVQRAEAKLLEQNLQLEALTRTDPLTQLPNRRFARDWLAHEVARAQRANKVFCVGVGDLDKFKIVNDNHGHDAGDEVLKHVSRTISSTLRKQDVVARWGGEEFLIILPETTIDGGKVALEKVRSKIEESPCQCDDVTISMTITIGVAEYHSEADMDDTIQKADMALYLGKNTGRNRIVISE